MKKIDETKHYKFSEIVRMVEDKELPIGTEVRHDEKTLYVESPNGYHYGLQSERYSSYVDAIIGSYDINNIWTIKLPREDKFYLKAPKEFRDKYLNFGTNLGKYFLSDKSCEGNYQTQFTQSEIDAMPFDTSFFGEPIKVEDE